jgi:hypothetical protein
MSKESRSQSMAAADELGHEHLGPEHLLIELLRTDGHAKTALNACGVTDASLLAEIRRVGPKSDKPPPPMLGRLGVALPKTPPPKARSWEAPVRLSRDEFERRTAELRAAGILYGFNYAGEEMLLLVERPDAPEE